MSGVSSTFQKQSRELVFGFVTNLLSSFGQSYMVSLFLLSLIAAAGISQGMFGLLYSAATLAAAFMLPVFGRWMDKVGEKVAFLMVSGGLLISLLLLASTYTWWVLVLALFGLRAFGQGAMTLLSAASIARRFVSKRGLALGLTNLGFPTAEMVLPSITILAIGLIGWRTSVLVYAVFVLIVVLAMNILVLSFATTPAICEVSASSRKPTRKVAVFRWWKDRFFILVTASSVVMPFGGTILLLYLAPISHAKNWDVDWIGAGYVVFAVVRATSSLLVGPLIDRFGALAVFPWCVGPFSFAVASLLLAPSPWFGLFFFLLLGLGFGSSTVLTALLAEAYRREQLGEIRSLSSSAGILGTALGPLATGFAIDAGFSFPAIMRAVLLLSLISWGAAFFVWRIAPHCPSSMHSTRTRVVRVWNRQ